MPWPLSNFQTRLALVTALQQPGATLSAICRQFEVSRRIARKWRDRFRQSGRDGLRDASRRPHRCPHRKPLRWVTEVLALRRLHPRWGARKLLVLLRSRHPRTRQLPSLRSLERWLHQAKLTRPPTPRTPPGPKVPRPALVSAHAPNEVWTIDFKGWFRTADGQRCEPLTIRDLYSRYILCVQAVAQPSDLLVRRLMTTVFTQYGLPAVLRVDNGSPFASIGPLNLSRLSVWWLRLGITVDFTRRGKPQDNGAHEQMHRILKADTASPPAPSLRAQRLRFQRWQDQYNDLRPHQALNDQTPAQLYSPSSRLFHSPAPCSYPPDWSVRQVRHTGVIKWHGRLRLIGRAFVGQRIGLRPIDSDHCQVHLGTFHIGNLHHQDPGSMRPARFQTQPSLHPKKTPAASS